MWNDYIIQDDFLSDKHFNYISSVNFNTDPNSWEIYKHQIFLNEKINVTYKNSSGLPALLNTAPLSSDKIIDIHQTYHNLMLSYLKTLSPDKVCQYKFTELNIVSNGKDYKFHIHNDSLDKLLSVVIYISPKKNKGTILYENKEGLSPVEIEWVQNRAFIFSRKEHTWHSYESDGTSNRVTLVYNLRG